MIPQAAAEVAAPVAEAQTLGRHTASSLEENLVEQLLLMFSYPGVAVVFPWLPSSDLFVTAHNLGRQVFAGDPIPERCRAAIMHAGSKVE